MNFNERQLPHYLLTQESNRICRLLSSHVGFAFELISFISKVHHYVRIQKMKKMSPLIFTFFRKTRKIR